MATRIPDRDRLLVALQDEGLDAEARGELEIAVGGYRCRCAHRAAQRLTTSVTRGPAFV
jgi:hypothetical protein